MSEAEFKNALREWIIQTSAKACSNELDFRTSIIEQRIITSLQVMDLILFIEKISDNSIEVDKLKPGVFKNIDSICANFFVEKVK